MYENNGVCFEHPESWVVVDDDGDDIIRAITIECPNGGYYSIDIYKLNHAPSLDSYIESSMKHFAQDLPVLCNMVGSPSRKLAKAVNKNTELEGLRLTFTVRSFFFIKTEYIKSYFKIISENKVSFISSQYSSDTDSGAGFNQMLSSYRSV
jgi:hypothetical protein